ncbi:hypothetical protein K8F61_09865 [Microbacterium resistens]|uniref:Uncharacterized protein n=1 Tax=Microbacterium resistens TaxID=156977 RepID=A0ABY3RP96_9MICO|nr:hypothetical protein [Microbacterium resistens]UGS25015.1 hypothetical protein K8F61_09865 [Microbacterium resistens]
MTPAYATQDDQANDVAFAVAQAAPVSLAATSLSQEDDVLRAELAEGVSVVLPNEATRPIELSRNDGALGARVLVPNATALGPATLAADGSVTYSGNTSTPAVNVLASEDQVRVSTVIASPEQPEQFSYDFGPGASIEVAADGSATVYRANGEGEGVALVETAVAQVQAPWAVDANGNDVATEYVVDGSTLTQVVKHSDVDVAYPVVADPTFDAPLPFQSRVRFDRAETKTIADLGIASLGGAVCGPMAAVCIAAGVVLAYNAGVAENSNPKRCVQVTLTTAPAVPPVWWVDTYLEGPCR